MELLKRYDWPGNARELENEIQRVAALASAGTQIFPTAFSPAIARLPEQRPGGQSLTTSLPKKLSEILTDTERQIVQDALTRHQGNLSRVVAELGISRNGLRKMILRLGLERYSS